MAVARDDLEPIAKDRPNQVRAQDLERRSLADDTPVRQRGDP
jgi:hypothetical protein